MIILNHAFSCNTSCSFQYITALVPALEAMVYSPSSAWVWVTTDVVQPQAAAEGVLLCPAPAARFHRLAVSVM